MSRPERAHPERSRTERSHTPHESYKLRIIMIGNSGVGKSSIVSRFIDSEFDGEMTGTAGINFKCRSLTVNNKAVTFQVWDTAGEERFWSITPAYCRKADGVILIYDITDSKTFDGIHFWMTKVRQYSPDQVEMMLLGNKLDMENQRAISKDTGREAAERMGSPFFEVSAMSGHKIDHAFEVLAEQILKKKELFVDERSRSYPYRIEEEPISVGNEDDESGYAKKKKTLSCCS